MMTLLNGKERLYEPKHVVIMLACLNPRVHDCLVEKPSFSVSPNVWTIKKLWLAGKALLLISQGRP